MVLPDGLPLLLQDGTPHCSLLQRTQGNISPLSPQHHCPTSVFLPMARLLHRESPHGRLLFLPSHHRVKGHDSPTSENVHRHHRNIHRCLGREKDICTACH